MLDDRIVLSTLMVTNNLDSPDPTPGMLRYAIDQADTDGAHGIGDDIEFASSLNGAHFLLQEGPLTLTAGANVAIWTTNPITGAEMPIYFNGDADNIFQVDKGATLDLNVITLAGGESNSYNGGNGGAINNEGTLTVGLCSFVNNSATGMGAPSLTRAP